MTITSVVCVFFKSALKLILQISCCVLPLSPFWDTCGWSPLDYEVFCDIQAVSCSQWLIVSPVNAWNSAGIELHKHLHVMFAYSGWFHHVSLLWWNFTGRCVCIQHTVSLWHIICTMSSAERWDKISYLHGREIALLYFFKCGHKPKLPGCAWCGLYT